MPAYRHPGSAQKFFAGAASFFKPDDCIVIRCGLKLDPKKAML
jgi:hypothetical protein